MTAGAWTSRSARMIAWAAVLVVVGVASAAAQSPAATPYDVSLFKWARSDDAPGFDREPLFHTLVVGGDGRVLLLGGTYIDETVRAAAWGSNDGRAWTSLEGELPTDEIAFDGVESGDGFLIMTALGRDREGNLDRRGHLFRSDGSSVEPLAAPVRTLIALERSPRGIHLLEAASPVLWTSADEGATWSSATITDDDALVRHLVVTDDGTIVVVGTVQGKGREIPTAWSSSDGGATWRAATLPIEEGRWAIGDLAWTPIGLIARVIDFTARDGSHVNLLSPDGITWEPTIRTTGWGSIGTAGPEAIIFGEDAAWHSADGETWTEEWWPTLAGFDVVASRQIPGGPVVAAGIQRTPPGSGATFVGAPAPQAVPSAPVELASPEP